MSEIKHVLLVSGEPLIAEVDMEEWVSFSNTLELTNPCRIGLQPTGPNEAQVGIQPWLIFSKEKKVTIPKHQVMFVTDPVDGLRHQYAEAFGKIVVAGPGNLQLIKG